MATSKDNFEQQRQNRLMKEYLKLIRDVNEAIANSENRSFTPVAPMKTEDRISIEEDIRRLLQTYENVTEDVHELALKFRDVGDEFTSAMNSVSESAKNLEDTRDLFGKAEHDVRGYNAALEDLSKTVADQNQTPSSGFQWIMPDTPPTPPPDWLSEGPSIPLYLQSIDWSAFDNPPPPPPPPDWLSGGAVPPPPPPITPVDWSAFGNPPPPPPPPPPPTPTPSSPSNPPPPAILAEPHVTAWSEVRTLMAQIADSVDVANRGLNRGRNALRGIHQITASLNDDEAGITDLQEKQLTKLKESLQSRLQSLNAEAKLMALRKGNLSISEAFNKVQAELGVLSRREVDSLTVQEKHRIRSLEQELELYAAAQDTAGVMGQVNSMLDHRLGLELQINKAMGIAGHSITATKELLDKVGLSQLKNLINFDEIAASAREVAKEVSKVSLRGGGEVVISYVDDYGNALSEPVYKKVVPVLDPSGQQVLDNIGRPQTTLVDVQEGELVGYSPFRQKLAVLGKTMGGLSSQFTSLLTDPSLLIGSLVMAIVDGSERINAIQNSIGANYREARKMALEFQHTADSSGEILVTGKELVKTYVELTKELGQSADILGQEALVSATLLTKKLGMSVKEAGQLVLFSRLQGKGTESLLGSTVNVVSALNRQYKTSIQAKKVMEDIANVDKGLALSLGTHPVALGRAVFEARRLGVSLAQVDATASGLLNFESSIAAELEAQLITGRNINLQKAREYALNNDLEKLSGELARNGVSAYSFSKMNRIEQESIADALSMSRTELANMAYQQELNLLSAKDFKKVYGEQTYDSLKALGAQEKFGDVLSKLQDIVGNLGLAFAPLLDGIAWLAEGGANAIAAITGPISRFIGGFTASWKFLDTATMGTLQNWIGGFASLGLAALAFKKNLFGIPGAIRSVRGVVSQTLSTSTQAATTAAQTVAGSMPPGVGNATTTMGQAQNVGNSIRPGVGSRISGFLTGLGDGLKGMSGIKVTQGILNMALLGASVIPFALSAKLFNEVGWESLAKGGTALLGLAGTYSILGKMQGATAQGALTIAMLGASLIPFAYGMQILEGVSWKTLGIATAGLIGLAVGAAILGPMLPLIAAGSAAIALLGVALIPLAGAVAIAAPGLGIFAEKLYEVGGSASSLLLLGPALLSAAAGIAAFSAVTAVGGFATGITSLLTGGGVLADLTALSLLAPGLEQTGSAISFLAASLYSMSGALKEIKTDDIQLLERLTSAQAAQDNATRMVEAITQPLNVLNKVLGGNSSENDNGVLVSKLEELIEVVKQGGDVYMDGNKVGQSLVLSSSKSA